MNDVAKSIIKHIEMRGFRTDRPVKSLVMYSGGLDSLAILYNILEHTEHEVHAHHIEIQNVENRAEAEIQAVNKQLKMLKKECRPFEYSRSRYEFDIGLGGGYDLTLSLIMAARYNIALGNTIRMVWTGHMMPVPTIEVMEGAAVFHSFFINKARQPIWLRPFAGMTKLDIYKSLDHKMSDTAWICRRPVYKRKEPTPCGECHSCKTQAQYLAEYEAEQNQSA